MIKRILLIILFICSNCIFAAEQKSAKFISFADIHFDPFVDCEKAPQPCPILKKLRNASYQDWESIFEKYGQHHLSSSGQDTNYDLLQSTLAELQKIHEKDHPQFALILGDFLAHNYRDQYIRYSNDKTLAGYQAFVKKTLQFLTIEINDIFPDIDVYPAIGNNDSYGGDYDVKPNANFLHDTQVSWAQLIKNKSNQANFWHDFAKSGYYVATVPNDPNQKIIVLNTVLFSTKVTGAGVNKAAQTQLLWLGQQLQSAQQHKQKVILAFHIPADINVSGDFGVIWKFWKPIYWDEFKKIAKKYLQTVTIILPAHIHKDIFQIIMLGSFSKIPVNFTPSISPIFGNNPSFKVFTYDLPEFNITNVNTYTVDLGNGENGSWEVGYTAHVPHIANTARG